MGNSIFFDAGVRANKQSCKCTGCNGHIKAITRTPQALKKDRYRLCKKAVSSRAAIFLGIGELTPFLYDHYVAKFSYSDISFKSIAHNLNPDSWGFDQDIFLTNQFGHPYQGSYFFNALRTNGYSFWQSVPGSFAGSYIWETAGENDSPDINDFINTGMGGAIAIRN